MKAPFQTQPEKKRRPSSTTRNSTQMNSNQRPSTARRSLSQQRRQSSSSATQSIVEQPPQTTPILSTLLVHNESNSMIDNHEPTVSDQITAEEPINSTNENNEMAISPIPQQIILNRALIKPLRRLWKQNQNLRLKLIREIGKKSTSSPLFIDRLNEQVKSVESIYFPQNIIVYLRFIHQLWQMIFVYPNIEVLLQLAIKLRAIVLYLLENCQLNEIKNE